MIMACMVKDEIARPLIISLITTIRLLLSAKVFLYKLCAIILPESERYFCIQWAHDRPAT